MKTKPHRSIAKEAQEALDRKEYRFAMTKFLDAFHSITDRWHSDRWQILERYTTLLRLPNFNIGVEDDVASLKAVMENKKELKLYRIEAAYHLGLLLHNKAKRRDESADCFREAIRLAEKIPYQEKKHKVLLRTSESVECGAGIFRPMEALISPCVNNSKEKLQALTVGVFDPNHVLSKMFPEAWGPEHAPPDQIDMSIFGYKGTVTPEEMNRLHTVGGERCDCCGKSREELPRKKLQLCQACERAYYCSRECQRKQWKAGHKYCCRKPGEFKPGDFIRLTGLQSKPQLNGTLAQIIGEDPKTKGRWQVTKGDMTGLRPAYIISVAFEKMNQTRPLK